MLLFCSLKWKMTDRTFCGCNCWVALKKTLLFSPQSRSEVGQWGRAASTPSCQNLQFPDLLYIHTPVLLMSTVGLQLWLSVHPQDHWTCKHAGTHSVLPLTSPKPSLIPASPEGPLCRSSLFFSSSLSYLPLCHSWWSCFQFSWKKIKIFIVL